MNPFQTVIDSLPGDIVDGLLEEIRTGWNMEAVQAEINNRRLGTANSSGQNRNGIEGLGRLRMEVDPTSYHFWGQKLGYQCWKDKEFLRRYEQQVPQARVRGGATRLQVGYGSAPSNSVKYRKVYSQ